jgi:hypothetical protein
MMDNSKQQTDNSELQNQQPQFVQVRLGDILPNPFRKIEGYPLSPAKIESLCLSIRDTDLWKNVIVRPSPTQPGKYELAYGHHRIAAGIKELGADHEHWFPLEHYSDYQMMQVLTNENSDDWSSPVEHWMLVVDVARDWLDTAVDSDGGALAREIMSGYSPDGIKISTPLQQFSPVARIFTALYINKDRALTALQTCRTQGVEAVHIAQFLGGRFISHGTAKDTGQPIHQPSLVITRAYTLLPTSPKRRAYLEVEAQRKDQARRDLEEQTRRAEVERRERFQAERDAHLQALEERRLLREAEKRRAEEQAKAGAALRAHFVAKHDEERRIAGAEHEAAQARAEQATEEQARRDRLAQEALRKATSERQAGEEQERRLKYLKEEKDRQERINLREQAMFERLQQDGQVDPEAIRLCKTWVLAAAFRDKVLEPNVQLYLPKDQQKGLLLDIINTKKERLTPEVLVREIDVRLGRVERVAAEMAELGIRIERAADDCGVKIRVARRAVETLRKLIEQARQDRNQPAMVSAIAAVSHANFAEIVRTIDDLRQDAEALAGIASPRPSSNASTDVPPPDYPSLTLVAG